MKFCFVHSLHSRFVQTFELVDKTMSFGVLKANKHKCWSDIGLGMKACGVQLTGGGGVSVLKS